MWVSVNGLVTPAAEARISPLDHGFLYGDSVYETLRTYGGRPFLLDAHLQRLQGSGAGLLLAPDFELDLLKTEIDRVLEAGRYPESMVRVIWSRGPGDLSYDPDAAQHATRVVINKPLTEYPATHWADGVGVWVVDVRRNPIAALDPRLKTSNLLNPRLAYMQARPHGAMEALLLSAAGTVAECSRANFFVVGGGKVRTPSVETGILNGITRRLALQLCREEGIPAEEVTLPASALSSCDEAFMTSTTQHVMPVTRIDGRPVGAGTVGPIVRRLMAAYDRFVAAGHWALQDRVAERR
ncbi:MAG TPA: aminotransferase class IV [Candidatus Xenobia bacterium]